MNSKRKHTESEKHKNMRKKLMAALLSLAMVFAMMPAASFAADGDAGYGFKASADGKDLGDVTKSEKAYSYTDWTGETKTVDLYTIALPKGTQSVDFVMDAPVLAYNYAKNGCTDDDYLAGAVDNYMEGNTQFTVKTDYNSDGNMDFIQIQTPYDSNYNSTLLYAVTFKYAEDTPAPSKKKLAAPAVKAGLASNKTAKLSWKKVSGAGAYVVYSKKVGASKWSSRTVRGTSTAVRGLKAGKKYSFKVIAKDGSRKSAFSKSVSVTTLGKPGAFKVKSSGGSYLMSWKKVKTAKGYQKKVWSSTEKKWDTVKKGKKLGTTKYRTISYIPHKTYKYKVRAWKKAGGKTIYGPWSKTKTVTHN
jgi:hypothetical protein